MAGIVDIHGNPITIEERNEPQTSRVAALHREFDTHPVRGLTPTKLARILEQAEQGDILAQCDLFEDMEERDGHVLCEMGKRKRSITTLDWNIVPPRNASAKEKADAAWAEEVIRDMAEIDEMMIDLLDAIGKGFSCIEIGNWRQDGKDRLPENFDHRPSRWFTFDQATRSEIRLRDMSLDGQALNAFGWIVHTHKAKSGHISRSGLHRVLSWPFLFKNYSVRDLAEFLEIYGLPMRLGKYPVGSSQDEKNTLLRAVVNIGHAAAGIVPDGMSIDFEEAAKGASDPFMAMIDWCERTQSKAIIGQTLSAESQSTGLGSGVADLHSDVRRDLTVSDAKQLAGTLTNFLVYPLLAVNRGIDSLRRCPRFVFDTTEVEDMKVISESLPKLVSAGMNISKQWAHDKLRIPQAVDDNDVLVAQSNKAGIAPLRYQPVAALRMDTANGDAVDLLSEQLAGLADQPVSDMVEKIRELVMAATDMQDLADRLLTMLPALHEETQQFAEVMGKALTAAALAGRYDILEGQ